MIICYHPDFGRFYNFRKQTQLDEVAAKLGVEIVFPLGGWCRAWQDKDVKDKPSPELDAFDRLTQGRKVFLCGYSDGAGLANYLATYRSEQVQCVVSYAGRLQRGDIETKSKFPVLDVWNERDKRYNSVQHNRMTAAYRMQSHDISRVRLPNNKTHWSGWDASANSMIREFISANR